MELVAIIVLALLLVPLVLLTTGPLRIVIGLLFLLFFPGYTLIAAVFPRKHSLDAIERVALSFGLSIAIVPLIALVLDHTPWGIRLYPIIVSVVSFTLTTSTIALYRRQRLPREERSGTRIHIRIPEWRQHSRLNTVLCIVLAISMLGAAGAVVYTMTNPKPAEKFTEFYVVGPQGSAADLPQKLVVGQLGEVTLVITNHEQQDTYYHVKVSLVGLENRNGIEIWEIGPISLAHKEKWEEKVTFVPTKAGGAQIVDFLLYKGEGNAPYRDLRLRLDEEEMR